MPRPWFVQPPARYGCQQAYERLGRNFSSLVGSQDRWDMHCCGSRCVEGRKKTYGNSRGGARRRLPGVAMPVHSSSMTRLKKGPDAEAGSRVSLATYSFVYQRHSSEPLLMLFPQASLREVTTRWINSVDGFDEFTRFIQLTTRGVEGESARLT